MFTATIPVTVVGSYLIKPTVCFTLHVERLFVPEEASAIGMIQNGNTTIVTNTDPTGFGSLFGAIQASNQTPGPHDITFAIAASGPVTIPVPAPLPALTNPATINLDATTEPGTSPLPRVVIDGSAAGAGAVGLTVLGGNTTVRGLGVRGFSGPGILVDHAGHDTIDGNFVTGTGVSGISVRSGASNVQVTNNRVQGVNGVGIRVISGHDQLVAGNTVLDSAQSGILLQGGVTRGTVSGNTVLGSHDSGVWVDAGTGNVVAGNNLGQPGRGNGLDGVTVYNATGTVIGGTAAGAGNTIQASGLVGVRLFGPLATGDTIAGNTIGDTAGLAAPPAPGTAGPSGRGNQAGGVFLDGVSGNTVGGTDPSARNRIGGNGGPGVQITGGSNNRVVGNFIGVDATGRLASGNSYDGVYLDRSSNNVVGGAAAGAGNVISGNGYVGVRIAGATATNNTIQGNRIGTNAAGAAALGNEYDGVFVTQGANHNLIGGTATGAGNLVSGNGGTGVQFFGAGTSGNTLAGNTIGTDLAGLVALPNRGDGVFVNGAGGNAIGVPGAGNLVSGNVGSGVQLFGAGAAGNTVQGNRIGLNSLGRPILGNAVGIFLNRAGANVLGGAGAAANVVAGNRTAQVVSTAPGVPGVVTIRAASVAARRVATWTG